MDLNWFSRLKAEAENKVDSDIYIQRINALESLTSFLQTLIHSQEGSIELLTSGFDLGAEIRKESIKVLHEEVASLHEEVRKTKEEKEKLEVKVRRVVDAKYEEVKKVKVAKDEEIKKMKEAKDEEVEKINRERYNSLQIMRNEYLEGDLRNDERHNEQIKRLEMKVEKLKDKSYELENKLQASKLENVDIDSDRNRLKHELDKLRNTIEDWKRR